MDSGCIWIEDFSLITDPFLLVVFHASGLTDGLIFQKGINELSK
jgi:hypothetical protein